MIQRAHSSYVRVNPVSLAATCKQHANRTDIRIWAPLIGSFTLPTRVTGGKNFCQLVLQENTAWSTNSCWWYNSYSSFKFSMLQQLLQKKIKSASLSPSTCKLAVLTLMAVVVKLADSFVWLCPQGCRVGCCLQVPLCFASPIVLFTGVQNAHLCCVVSSLPAGSC